MHDLDKRDEKELRRSLEDQVADLNYEHKVILIPIEEIEAWLLCDPAALKTVFRMAKLPKTPKSPELIPDPKQLLADIIRKNSKTQYLNTIHNRRIASALSISKLGRCPSFSAYPKFLMKVFPRAVSRVL